MSNMIKNCNACPRMCGANRAIKKGICGMGTRPVLAGAFLHKWEEPCISGTMGSGAVFFSGCSLNCVFCQNYSISCGRVGKEVSIERLGEIFLSLQEEGAHNINLVSPSHFSLQISVCLEKLIGLEIPVIYNSNGYDCISSLSSLESRVSVYLPDFKYFSSELSSKYSGAADYFDAASKAILEMHRQVGAPEFDSSGMIYKGLIIRHLILPGQTRDSIKILDWIWENLPHYVYISLMSQYTPYYKAFQDSGLNRRITRREYEKVVNHLLKLGFEHGYIQELTSACEEYVPEFNLQGLE
jgi:putative pyruvate formate lyase activating enzyme